MTTKCTSFSEIPDEYVLFLKRFEKNNKLKQYFVLMPIQCQKTTIKFRKKKTSRLNQRDRTIYGSMDLTSKPEVGAPVL